MSDTVVLQVVFTAMMVAAALHDLTTGRIPHLLSAWVVIMAVVTMSHQPDGVETLINHLSVACVVLVCGFILAMAGPFGGGDMYFAAAISFWMGSYIAILSWLLQTMLLFTLMGGVLLGLKLVDARVFAPSLPLPVWLRRAIDPRISVRRSLIPAALPMSLAAVLWVWS